jgi:hypothetical protein
MSVIEIGCCGAYCRTCREWQKDKYPNERSCRGCKLGYENEERDINKTKCKIKICCYKEKSLETCADCQQYHTCTIIHGFYDKKGYKYKKYKQSIEYIRKNGYDKFMKFADTWKGPHGKLF